MGALTQEQTNRLQALDGRTDLSPKEKEELNVLQKIETGEDTDADNKGGNNNPVDFSSEDNANEASLTEEERRQRQDVERQSSNPNQDTR